MIDHLHIKNFLAFPELEVPELKLINLVAGKNNAGKTALIDALRLYFSLEKDDVGKEIAKERGREDKYFSEALVHRSNDVVPPKATINDLEVIRASAIREVGYEIQGKPFSETLKPYHIGMSIYEYVEASTNSHDWIVNRWDSFVLTEKEEQVVEILQKTINKSISRIAVTDNKVLVKIEGIDLPVNISYFGDGIVRLLQIAIALVQSKPRYNKEGTYLLIDEIETHLHHSVIRKLWKIIFEYAIKWNIQVVATTHSQDAIREFWYEAAENEEYQKISQVLRLQIGREGKHEVIQYPFERLDAVLEMKMEIR